MSKMSAYADVTVAPGDYFLIRDVSDTTQSAGGSTKETAASNVVLADVTQMTTVTAEDVDADFDVIADASASGFRKILRRNRTTRINTQTGAAYTLAAADANGIVEMNNAGANTLTIPANATTAIPVGAVISITQYGAGTTTVQAASGVTLNGVSAGGATMDGQYKGVSLYKRATDEWIMQGSHGTVA